MFVWIKRGFLSLAILGILFAGAAQAQNGPPDRIKVLIGFDRTPGAADEALVRGLGGAVKYRYHLVPGIAASIPENAMAALLRSPRVTSVTLDGIVHAIDDELANTWGVQHVGAGTVHAGGNKGGGILVAVIDSGIDCDHPDLNVNCTDGYDFVNDDDYPMDDNDHGTHVSGTIAAVDDHVGVIGMAPDASLYGLKVLSASGSGYWSDIIAALQWVVVYNASNDPDIRVTNNSYGSSGNPGGLVQTAFDNAYAQGILHIAAAGNTGNCGGKGNKVGYPARYDSVVAVAATNSSDGSPCFSSTGPAVELAAPGVSVNSTVPDDGYAVWNGTSMASPHVAGAAALVAAADGTLTNDEIRQRLVDTAIDLGPTGWDTYYGYGLIDVAAAVVPDSGFADDPPWVEITDPDPAAGTVSGMVPVTAYAEDDYGVVQVEFFIGGTSGTSIGVDMNGADGWTANWDATEACNVAHTVSAEATDTNGQTGMGSVIVTVANDLDFCAVPAPEPGTVSVGSISEVTMDASDPPLPVTVTGSGFQFDAVLTFEGGKGSAPTATNVVVISANELTATVSAKSKGKTGTHLFDVVVTNGDGSSASLSGGFTLTR